MYMHFSHLTLLLVCQYLLLVCQYLLSNMVCWFICNVLFVILKLVEQSLFSTFCCNVIHLQFFVFDTKIGLPVFLVKIQKIHLHTFLLFLRFFTFICPSPFLMFSLAIDCFFFLLEFELKTFATFQ